MMRKNLSNWELIHHSCEIKSVSLRHSLCLFRASEYDNNNEIFKPQHLQRGEKGADFQGKNCMLRHECWDKVRDVTLSFSTSSLSLLAGYLEELNCSTKAYWHKGQSRRTLDTEHQCLCSYRNLINAIKIVGQWEQFNTHLEADMLEDSSIFGHSTPAAELNNTRNKKTMNLRCCTITACFHASFLMFVIDKKIEQ